MDCNGRTFEELPTTRQKNCFEREGCNLRNGRIFEELPIIKNATYQWAAMDCNEKNFEVLPLTNIEL